ncbi:MAG: dockerin type I domain-containing protein [Pirellulales bacterium]
MRPRLEKLEDRRLMAADWQAQPNPRDVDASGLVMPLDVLLIINDINQGGSRTLPAQKPAGYSGALCDVNGDGKLSPLDVLLVINAINQNPNPPTLDVGLTDASDNNHDQVVLSNQVRYAGTTSQGATVQVLKVEGEQTVEVARVEAGDDGKFQIDLALPAKLNDLKFVVTDQRGRAKTVEREVRVGDVISAWNATMLETIRESTNVSTTIPGLLIKPPPPMVAKSLAMVHGAMFDAINAVQPTYDGYALDGSMHSSASTVAAAAQAAYRVASSIYPAAQEITRFDKTLAEILATVPEGTAKSEGIALGNEAADAMLALRAADGSTASSSYTPVNQPGHWNPTPPNFANAVLPQWPGVTPFALTDGDQFRPAPPPALDSAEYAAAVDKVMKLGAATGSQRTVDQTSIALYWADGGGTSTPPGHWNQIAMDAAEREQSSLLQKARTMALLNYAMADAGIASWDAKYAYDVWRPIDAIRKADQDGNAATTPVSDWSPLLSTPAFPSYTSGHSTFSAAAATVLESIFGTHYAFSSRADRGSTGAWPPSDDVQSLAQRSFDSFRDAADEAGMSRIYGGIHYSFDNTAGSATGTQVGQWTVDHLLRPII